MSVFLLNPDNEVVIDSPNSSRSNDIHILSNDAHQTLNEFWPRTLEEIRRIEHMDIRCQSLPLARIKKIMKLDEDVKMISAEAPVLFAKAAEMFIQEITLRSWVHTEDNKRRTLQRNDIAMAITKYDQFDFLIDIVPREEMARPVGGRSSVNLDQVHYYLQLNQQQGGGGSSSVSTGGTTTSTSGVTAAAVEAEDDDSEQLHIVQQQEVQTVIPSPGQSKQSVNVPSSGSVQVLQQVVGPNGEISHIPIQIPERQMELIRIQLENGATPVVLSPQVVQVRQPNPMYIQALNTQQN